MRLEIAAGLERGIPVVPVLVDDASKPRADQLPPELAALASRQAVRISHASFDVDSDRLIASLTKRRKSRRSVLIAAAIGAITVAATAAVVISPPHIPSATSRTLSPPASSAVKPVSWQNFTYKLTCDGIADSGFADQNGIIATLHNGLAVAKGENGIQGEYDVKFRVAVSGDITGDGQPETIVLLSCSPKGANYFVDEVQVFGPSNKLMGELPSPDTLQGEAVLAPEYVPAELRVEGGNVVAGMLFYAVGASHADGATEAHTITWHWTGSLFEKVNTS
jgi:hypothetical protein